MPLIVSSNTIRGEIVERFNAFVAQGIEHGPPEAGAQVRILSRAHFSQFLLPILTNVLNHPVYFP